jgi:hypothetical protein
MYTEVFISAEFRRADPATPILLFMFSDGPEPAELPDHEFFQTERWRWLGKSSSYYFQPEVVTRVWSDSEIGNEKQMRLVNLSNLKNYDNEIEKFFGWLSTTGAEYFGYSRYEETPRSVTQYFSAHSDKTSYDQGPLVIRPEREQWQER